MMIKGKRTAKGYCRRGALLLALVFLWTHLGQVMLQAAPTPINAPTNYQVKDIGYDSDSYTNNWFVELGWTPPAFPTYTEAYYSLELNEILYGSGQIRQGAFNLPVAVSETGYKLTEYFPEGLKHGTIYQSTIRAVYSHSSTADGNYTVTSSRSNPVKFLTDLDVSAELIAGTNQIKIKWDDVWDTTGRINYQILISDAKGFTNPPAIPLIVGSNLSNPDVPITINQAERKLEFTYMYAQPGREYNIKVIPLPASNVSKVPTDEIEVVTIKTDILLSAVKVGYTNEGDTVWKLSWNPVVIDTSTASRVEYELYRYTNSDPNPLMYRLIPGQDSYELVIPKGDTNTYSFRMDAKVYMNDGSVMNFISNNKVILREQIPQQPEAPEITDSFPDASPSPLYFSDLLTSSEATVMWLAPYDGQGYLDTNVSYDIYLTEDINEVTTPDSLSRIASDLYIGSSGQIKNKNTGLVEGHKYTVGNLKSNTTYYFVIYAKKHYLVRRESDGVMVSTAYYSKQSVKVIVTKPDASADRPVAPPSPPFAVKSPAEENVTLTGATLTLKKLWYGFFNETKKGWDAVDKADYEANALLSNGNPEKKDSVLVNYGAGWKVIPHVISYSSALTAVRIHKQDPTIQQISYNDLVLSEMDAFKIQQSAVNVPNIADDALPSQQNFDIPITGLAQNTAYIIWVTIQNQNGDISDASDPVIITTPADVSQWPVIPTVPEDVKGIAADNFIDLFWTYKSGMNYEIKAGTSDSLSGASITATVTYAELMSQTYYRLAGLSPNTLYYIWVRAVSTGSTGGTLYSDYSNPLLIKTEAFRPPSVPTGFGIKGGTEGITQNSVAYEWETLTGLKYWLEFSDNANFTNSKWIEVAGDNYTVTGLISNRRYYARLYAEDLATGLRSESTRTIMVITNKSKDDYDSNYDLDDALTGDGLIIGSKVENGVWIITSVDANSHLLAEKIRSVSGPVMKLDLTNPPSSTVHTVRLDLGAQVIDALSAMKKELYIQLPFMNILLKPGTLETDTYFTLRGQNANFTVRLETVSPASQFKAASEMQLKSPIAQVKVQTASGGGSLGSFIKPLQVEMPVNGISSYGAGQIKNYASQASGGAWSAIPSWIDYKAGNVVGSLSFPGAVTAAAWGVTVPVTVPSYVADSLEAIQSVYSLKSLSAGTFNANANITDAAAAKLLLDVMNQAYTASDVVEKAARSGLVQNSSEIANSNLRKDKAIDMLASLYRLKTHESITPSRPNVWYQFKDLSNVNAKYLNAFKFALENGIVQGNGSGYSQPEKILTYGEFLSLLERVLRLCGEL